MCKKDVPHYQVMQLHTAVVEAMLEMLLTAINLVTSQMKVEMRLASMMMKKKKMVVTILLNCHPS